MRRLIRFPCGDAMLSGSLDLIGGAAGADADIGLICVTGGSQTRVGPHRMLHRVARDVSAAGFPVFRYERRGVGDSDGEDGGYRDSGPDLVAAVAAFRKAAPRVRAVLGFGLCDGATTLALHGKKARVAGLFLLNPWLFETASGELAPAATRAHYQGRLSSLNAWSNVLRGRVDLIGSVRSILRTNRQKDATLAIAVADGLRDYVDRTALLLAEGDGTAIAAKACWAGPVFQHMRSADVTIVPTNAHTFARADDMTIVTRTAIAFMQTMQKTF